MGAEKLMYVIKNTAGEILGVCTNRPGAGNVLPDGTPEIVEQYEDDPNHAQFDAVRVAEVEAFKAAQAAKLDLAAKRDAALMEIEIERLAQAAANPQSGPAVRSYVEALG